MTLQCDQCASSASAQNPHTKPTNPPAGPAMAAPISVPSATLVIFLPANLTSCFLTSLAAVLDTPLPENYSATVKHILDMPLIVDDIQNLTFSNFIFVRNILFFWNKNCIGHYCTVKKSTTIEILEIFWIFYTVPLLEFDTSSKDCVTST